jgi:hypothetical protein
MKLKIEHLAPYLPYGLKVLCIQDIDGVLYKHINLTERFYSMPTAILTNFKPILRPLSDFNTGIAKDIMKDLNCSYLVISDIWNFEYGKINLKDIRFETYNVMCKNHIDFNGLIKKGLAIDINTL